MTRVKAWDVSKIIDEFGGAQNLRLQHAKLCFKTNLTDGQISNWKTRYTIPSDRLAEVLLTLRAYIGLGADPTDYILLKPKGDKLGKLKRKLKTAARRNVTLHHT